MIKGQNYSLGFIKAEPHIKAGIVSTFVLDGFLKNPFFKMAISGRAVGRRLRFTFWLTFFFKVICYLYSLMDCFYIW